MMTFVLFAFSVGCSTASARSEPIIGDEPAIKIHISQDDISSGALTVKEIIDAGEELFLASFNSLDGAGRPQTADIVRDNNNTIVNTRPRQDFPHNFNRISGPDANTCLACHNVPRAGGGGDNSTNIFALADRLTNVNFDGGISDKSQSSAGPDATSFMDAGLERNSPALFGSGWIELLAREMTTDLHDIVEDAINQAKESGSDIKVDLITKGVSFGSITARRDATIDTTEVEGIDNDLVIRPFQQKGVVVSLREFGVKAMNSHFGMQALENFRRGVDVDRDGVVDELSIGDITALVAFQATLPVPGRIMPSTPEELAAVEHGEELFSESGCAVCHVPLMRINSPNFTEPGPFNPGGKLQATDVANPFSLDLTTAGPGPHLKPEPDGSVLIPVFTDLKRHKMGDILHTDMLVQDGVPTDEFITRKLWGFASEPPFLHHGRALLVSEAILAHGGDAQKSRDQYAALTNEDQASIVEFLNTLQIMPEGSTTLEMSIDDAMIMADKNESANNKNLIVIVASSLGIFLMLIGTAIVYLFVKNRGYS
jgi:cytochrome c peroxidase